MDPDLPPREVYNQALAMMDSQPDRAMTYLDHVRGNAGTDGELRFRTLYNLAWLEVQQADTLLKDDPEKALQHLHQAGARFREAVRVRPESKEARQNLEIVSRRILELTDALRKKTCGPGCGLDELITETRGQLGELQQLVQTTSDLPAGAGQVS